MCGFVCTSERLCLDFRESPGPHIFLSDRSVDPVCCFTLGPQVLGQPFWFGGILVGLHS
jgi:hypothetical protein